MMIILTIGLSSLYAYKSNKNIFIEYATALNILKPCYNASDDFFKIFAQEGINYSELEQKITRKTQDKLSKIIANDNNKSKIPPITHHIYFTPEESSKQLNDFYNETMKATFARLNNLNIKWNHYIWTNNPKIFPEDLKQIKGVEIKSIAELSSHILYKDLVESIKNGEKQKAYYSQASDILRFLLVQKFGGIYGDMDYEIYNAKALYELMQNFDFIGGKETSQDKSYYGSAFLAAKANHPILNEIIKKYYRNAYDKNPPEYIKYPCRPTDGIYFNAPPLVTISFFKKNNIEENNDIILPSWMIFNVSFARFKNKTCDYNSITKSEAIKNNNNLAKLIEQFINKSDNHSNEKIIGADMFCGGWASGNKEIKKRIYYWSWKY